MNSNPLKSVCWLVSVDLTKSSHPGRRNLTEELAPSAGPVGMSVEGTF